MEIKALSENQRAYKDRFNHLIGLVRRLILFYLENKFYHNYFSHKPIVVYVGAANSLNLGDVLLYKAIQKIFSQCIIVPNFPTSNIKNRVILLLIRTLGTISYRGFRSPSAIMLGGGTLMNNPFFFEILKSEYKPNIDFFIFGTAVQDLNFWGDYLEPEIEIYKQARFVGLRNPYDANVLIEKGLQAQVVGDPVLYLCQPRQKERAPRKIGINIGCDRYKVHESQDKVNNFVIQLVKALVDNGFVIELFAMHYHDAEDINYIYSEICQLPNITLWTDYHNYESFLNKIHDYDLVIGQRLHAIITACGSGIPSISLSYRPKCLHFMEAMKLEKYCIPVNQLDASIILNLVYEILSDYDEIRNSLISITNHYRSLTESSKQLLLDMIMER
jgi:Polysaccharide pyruvyl transferase